MKRFTFAVWLSAFLYVGPLAWPAELVIVEGRVTGLTELLARSGTPGGVVVHVGCG